LRPLLLLLLLQQMLLWRCPQQQLALQLGELAAQVQAGQVAAAAAAAAAAAT
jgi:hypothetical protein